MRQVGYKVLFHDRSDSTLISCLESRMKKKNIPPGFFESCFEVLDNLEIKPKPKYIIIDSDQSSHVYVCMCGDTLNYVQ